MSKFLPSNTFLYIYSFNVVDYVTTVGVKRHDYGTDGSTIRIRVNAFEASIPQSKIYHYDGACIYSSVD